MFINSAFYQIVKNVTASDLAKIIGAKIIGAEKVFIEDIDPFDSVVASALVFQTDPELLRNSDIKAAIIITNEDGAAVVGPEYLFIGAISACWFCSCFKLFNCGARFWTQFIWCFTNALIGPTHLFTRLPQ